MDQLLNHKGFQQKLVALAERKGENFETVHAEAAVYLKELHTQHKPMANLIGVQLSQFVLGRAYDQTIDINPKEVKEVAKLVRKTPSGFCDDSQNIH